MKTCRTCGEVKALKHYHKAKVNTDGYEHRCKDCKKAITQTEEFKEKRRQRSYKYALKHHYGLTVEDYEQMIEDQGNRCACCGDHWDNVVSRQAHARWCVDHNHETGEVRGLLCNACNAMLGHAQDSIHRLAKGIEYLNERGSYGS